MDRASGRRRGSKLSERIGDSGGGSEWDQLARGRGAYSQREFGPLPRTEDDLTEAAWGGLIAILESHARANAFAMDYPAVCDDKPYPTIGTDERILALAVADHAPPVTWPLRVREVPVAAVAMDLIEFAWSHVTFAREEESRWHSYFDHYHLAFDQAAGRRRLRDEIGGLFARHGLAYALGTDGRISRTPPPGMDTQLRRLVIDTGDVTLDRLLSEAINSYSRPDPSERKRGLQDLWDAFERTKTLAPGDKKASVARLLNAAADDGPLHAWLDRDARDLTTLGNDFQVRHSEIGKHPLEDPAQVDYFFGRAFNWIWLIVRAWTRDAGR